MAAAGRLTNLLGRVPGAHAFTQLHARMYRRSGGRLGRRWIGAPVLVLETVGRKSGKQRATPLIYARDGDAYLVVAANAGAAADPAWWLNLRAAGEAELVVAGERLRVRASALEGAERERCWRLVAEAYAPLDDYPRFTDRELPVIRLEPLE